MIIWIYKNLNTGAIVESPENGFHFYEKNGGHKNWKLIGEISLRTGKVTIYDILCETYPCIIRD